MYTKFLIIILTSFMLLSCKTARYKHFSLRESPWSNTGELRTDGYYYCNLNKVKNYFSNPFTEEKIKVILLYQNGLFCTISDLFPSLAEAEEYLKKHNHDLGIKDKYAYWGRYAINNNTIFIEYFFRDFASLNALGVYRNYGILKNYKSFIITKRYMVGYEDKWEMFSYSLGYTFVPFSLKPDSTNWMMKKSGLEDKNPLLA